MTASKTVIYVQSIARYPVKGLSVERLSSVDLLKDQGIPWDRRFAITHAASKFDHKKRQWVSRRNFVVVAHSPGIASLITSVLDGGRTLVLKRGSLEVARVDTNQDCVEILDSVFSDLTGQFQVGPYTLVREQSLNNLTDSPTQTVSLMNCQSLDELSTQINRPLSQERFRGNIWFQGASAWQELDWINREITLGKVRLKVIEPIERCAAIDVDPTIGKSGPQVLKTLVNKFGHAHFGVLAQVTKGGRLETGTRLQVGE